MSLGTVTTGGSVSRTVTVKASVVTLPAASVAVTLTVVVPRGKREPDAGVTITTGVEQLSVAETLNVTAASLRPGAVATVMFGGSCRAGRSRSWIVTAKLLVERLPEGSAAVQTTVVTPTGKMEPEAGVQVMVAPGSLST